MTDKELIKWFKKYTAITKKDNEIAETVGLELNVEISVEMAERLINLIEKQQEELEHYKNIYEQEKMKKQDMINQIQQLEEEAREIELQKLEDYYNEG